MLELIGSILPRRRKSDWASVVEALRGGAAFLAQGSSYSYLRARTLLAGPRLFQDAGFGFALQICKWETFAVAAQDLILIIETEVRDLLPDNPGSKAKVLAGLYREVLESESMPEHRADRGWGDVIEEFDKRLDRLMSEPLQKADAISEATALRLLEHAPIDDLVRQADRTMIVNNVAFRTIDHLSTLRKTLDLPAIAAEIARRMESHG